MRRGDGESAFAHQVARVAEDECLRGIEVRDDATVLLLLSIAVGDGSLDLGLDGGGGLLKDAVDEGGSLTVLKEEEENQFHLLLQ